MEEKTKIKSFTDLIAWQESHQFVLLIYKLTGSFPSQERFCLVDQMRRAAISITSNIAEGFARQYPKEKIQFYAIALGSNSELQSQLVIARDLDYITKADFDLASNKSIVANKLVNGLMSYCRK